MLRRAGQCENRLNVTFKENNKLINNYEQVLMNKRKDDGREFGETVV